MEDITRGGQFLVKETKCENVFTPEDFSEEQIMMRDSVKEFVDKEIWPNKDRFEKKDLCIYGRSNAKSRRNGLFKRSRSGSLWRNGNGIRGYLFGV